MKHLCLHLESSLSSYFWVQRLPIFFCGRTNRINTWFKEAPEVARFLHRFHSLHAKNTRVIWMKNHALLLFWMSACKLNRFFCLFFVFLILHMINFNERFDSLWRQDSRPQTSIGVKERANSSQFALPAPDVRKPGFDLDHQDYWSHSLLVVV